MTDPKTSDFFVDDDSLRPSHDMLETAREISFSPDEQEEAVAQEAQLRQEQAARALHDQAVAAYEALVLQRGRERRALILHAMLFVVGSPVIFAVNQAMGGAMWFPWPLIAWTLALAGHATWVRTRAPAVPPAPLPSPGEAAMRAALAPNSTANRLPLRLRSTTGTTGAHDRRQSRRRRLPRCRSSRSNRVRRGSVRFRCGTIRC